KPALLGHETDGRYLQTAPPDSAMFVARIAARLEECAGHLQIAFPFITIEPYLRQLRQEWKSSAEAALEIVAPRPLLWKKALEEMIISLTAELPPLQLSARAVSRLKVGDALPLPVEFANRV